MNISPINIARSFDYTRLNNASANKYENKNYHDLSVGTSENFEPGEKDFPSDNVSKINPQYKPSSPVVKTSPAAKEILEVIHYEDVLEKTLSETEIVEKQIQAAYDINHPLENSKKIGKGFYLIIKVNNKLYFQNTFSVSPIHPFSVSPILLCTPSIKFYI